MAVSTFIVAANGAEFAATAIWSTMLMRGREVCRSWVVPFVRDGDGFFIGLDVVGKAGGIQHGGGDFNAGIGGFRHCLIVAIWRENRYHTLSQIYCHFNRLQEIGVATDQVGSVKLACVCACYHLAGDVDIGTFFFASSVFRATESADIQWTRFQTFIATVVSAGKFTVNFGHPRAHPLQRGKIFFLFGTAVVLLWLPFRKKRQPLPRDWHI